MFAAAAIVLVAIVSSMGLAISSGVDQEAAEAQAGSLEVGCTCHSEVPTPSVQPILEGVPGVYGAPAEAGGAYEAQTYNLTVRTEGVNASAYGFNLHVTAGTLEVAEGEEDAQILDSGDATHNKPSDDGVWQLIWTAPDSPDEAVVFRLTINAVNANGAADPDDQWNRAIFASQGAEGAGVGTAAHEALHVETLGVNWLAYWVGIASFVFMIVVLFLYYFVFRYSETSHATDHRARKKKAA